MEEGLTINAAFAASFTASSARAHEQRKAALVSSVPVPARVLAGFLTSLAAPLRHASAAPLRRVAPPLTVAAHVFSLHRLCLGSDIAPEQRAPFAAAPLSDPAALAALAAFLGEGGPGRAPVAKLLRWARGRAYAQKLQATAERDAAAAAQARSAGAGQGAARAAGVKAGKPAKAEEAEEREGEREEEEAEEEAEGVEWAAVERRAPVAQAAAQAPGPATVLSGARKRKGRGCGRGRGLGPAGEPEHADLHPSWKARRVQASRQRKAIHRDLHKLAQ